MTCYAWKQREHDRQEIQWQKVTNSSSSNNNNNDNNNKAQHKY